MCWVSSLGEELLYECLRLVPVYVVRRLILLARVQKPIGHFRLKQIAYLPESATPDLSYVSMVVGDGVLELALVFQVPKRLAVI
jgi:hypothetical protein